MFIRLAIVRSFSFRTEKLFSLTVFEPEVLNGPAHQMTSMTRFGEFSPLLLHVKFVVNIFGLLNLV